MNTAIATLGCLAVLTTISTAVYAQSTPFGSADTLQGLEERSVRTLSSTSSRSSSLTSNDYSSDTSNQPVGIQIDQNLQLQVKPEQDSSQLGVYPTDDTGKGNRLQLIYEFEEPAQGPLSVNR